ncbi:MAG: sigma-70 family RNA polymerase sigma factor [Pyrinomonadaceae bacterium]
MPPGISVEYGTRNEELAALIKSLAVGDQSAMTTLYDSTSRLIYGLVLRILNEASTAEEVMLDVYMQVWRQASNYDATRGAPLAWLTTIARSRAIDRLRSGSQERHLKQPLESAAASIAPGASAEDFTVASEMQKLVREALDTLPPEQREVIEWAYYGGLSHSEIAVKLGQPLGTIKTRTRLGMMKLREALKSTYARGL